MKTYRDVIELWPSAAELARDLRANKETVRKWGQKGRRIPEDHWDALLTAAHRRGIRLAPSDLIKLAAA